MEQTVLMELKDHKDYQEPTEQTVLMVHKDQQVHKDR